MTVGMISGIEYAEAERGLIITDGIIAVVAASVGMRGVQISSPNHVMWYLSLIVLKKIIDGFLSNAIVSAKVACTTCHCCSENLRATLERSGDFLFVQTGFEICGIITSTLLWRELSNNIDPSDVLGKF